MPDQDNRKTTFEQWKDTAVEDRCIGRKPFAVFHLAFDHQEEIGSARPLEGDGKAYMPAFRGRTFGDCVDWLFENVCKNTFNNDTLLIGYDAYNSMINKSHRAYMQNQIARRDGGESTGLWATLYCDDHTFHHWSIEYRPDPVCVNDNPLEMMSGLRFYVEMIGISGSWFEYCSSPTDLVTVERALELKAQALEEHSTLEDNDVAIRRVDRKIPGFSEYVLGEFKEDETEEDRVKRAVFKKSRQGG